MYNVLYGALPTREDLLASLDLTEAYEALTEDAADLVDACLAVAAPKAVWAHLSVQTAAEGTTIGEVRVDAPFVAEKLAACTFAIPYIATCGAEVEAWADGLTDPLERYWADKLKLALLGAVMGELKETLRAAYFTGETYMAALNPGSLPQWPISEQIKLFAMLGDGAEKIGVTLKPSYLMVPTKSCSGIYFAHGGHYENCMLCPRIDCPNRRAPFAGEESVV
ncbi:MAG: hypothetical protein IKU55_05470 [Clostridia bacterium]|nr:hypothetical protein [Clostridia bacterium]